MRRIIGPLALAVIAVAIVGSGSWTPAMAASAGKVPEYRIDPAWPQLPNNWSLGQVANVMIGPDGHVWILHRPHTVAAGKQSAPPVIEFDGSGKFVHAWGGQGEGY